MFDSLDWLPVERIELFLIYLFVHPVYPQKQQYAYAGYPPQHYPPGPYYHGSQYGPYNYWDSAQLNPNTSHHQPSHCTRPEHAVRSASSNSSLSNSLASYQSFVQHNHYKNTDSRTNSESPRIVFRVPQRDELSMSSSLYRSSKYTSNAKCNLSMIEENPSMCNNYMSGSFLSKSQSVPSISGKSQIAKPQTAKKDETYSSATNRQTECRYETPVSTTHEVSKNYRRHSSENPNYILRPYEVDERLYGTRQIYDNYASNPVIRPSGTLTRMYHPADMRSARIPPEGFIVDLPALAAYDNLYLAFLYWSIWKYFICVNVESMDLNSRDWAN